MITLDITSIRGDRLEEEAMERIQAFEGPTSGT
jgi:hypothetical protein